MTLNDTIIFGVSVGFGIASARIVEPQYGALAAIASAAIVAGMVSVILHLPEWVTNYRKSTPKQS